MKRFIPSRTPAGILFDMDGVLVDTQHVHFLAFEELCQRHGLTLTEERFRTLFGMENRKLVPLLFGRAMDDGEIQTLADWKEARYREMISGRISLMEGVPELVAWAEGVGIAMAVASSAPRANVVQILTATGLIDRVGAYLGSEDVTRHKPHPEAYQRAAERVGVSAPECWVIEDSLHGIEAGLKSGACVLAVATTHDASELEPAHGVFENAADILSMAKTIPS